MKICNTRVPKKPISLTINSDLLSKAREMNINLSETLEMALAERLRTRQKEPWLKGNRKAIQAYNSFAEKEGVFGDDVRTF